MAQYVSEYTGTQIDNAVKAYLNGGNKAYAAVDITANDWKWSGKFPYTCKIELSGTYNTGDYPYVAFYQGKGDDEEPVFCRYNYGSPKNNVSTVTLYSNFNTELKVVFMCVKPISAPPDEEGETKLTAQVKRSQSQ